MQVLRNLLLFVALVLLVACGGGSFSGGGDSKNGIAVTIAGSKVIVPSRGVHQFTATVSGSHIRGVAWSTTAGTITSTGLYKAPAVTTVSTAVVTARSTLNSAIAATVVVTIQPAMTTPRGPVSISPAMVTIRSGKSQQFAAIVSGATNPGITWSATDGAVTSSGLFTAPGVNATTIVTLKATSNADVSESAVATATVLPPSVQHLVDLSWSASPSANILGYNVYRAQSESGPYFRVNTGGAVASTVYTDTGVVNGITYYYVTTVVDSAGRESSHSNQARALIPQ